MKTDIQIIQILTAHPDLVAVFIDHETLSIYRNKVLYALLKKDFIHNITFIEHTNFDREAMFDACESFSDFLGYEMNGIEFDWSDEIKRYADKNKG